MTEPNANFLPKMHLLPESFYCDLVEDIIRLIKRENQLTYKEIGARLFVDEKTIKNAATGDHKLSAHTLFNLLTISPSALELLLHYFDRRSVPLGSKCDVDALQSTAAAMHKIAVASSHDGPITDRECLDMEPTLDAAIEALCGLKSRCLEIREERA